MPEALSYPVDQATNEAKALEDAYKEEQDQRRPAIARAWSYYDGDHKLPLKMQADGYNDNVVVNHVGDLAERIVAFMVGAGVTFDAEGDSEQADQEANELWEANRGDILTETLVLAGAIEGHNAVRLQPMDGDWAKLTRVRQANFAAFWDPFDMSRVLWYRLQHVAAGRGKRIDYVRGVERSGEFDHDAEGWTELVYEARNVDNVPGNRPRWERTGDQLWPYPWSPIVDWQNSPNANGYYGRRDVDGAIRLNDALNFILSNAQRIVKHYASPATVGTGFTAQELVQTAVGGLWTVASADAKVYNLEMESDGAMMQWLTQIITAGLWQSGGMVDNSTVKDLVGQLTNFGLRVLFAGAIQRTEKKRRLYAEAFDEITRHGLELAGRTAPEMVHTVWPDVLPEDEATVQQLMAEMQEQVISKQTYRGLRGYDHETEEERLSEEQATDNVGAGILGLLANNRQFNRGV